MQKVKYAMVGFGGIAENRIAKEGFARDSQRFSPLKNAELVAATDVNKSRQAAAEALGLRWCGSAQDIFADKDIDAVFIATNNLSHSSVAAEAMRAGKHVIVEKPIATTVPDAQMLVKLAGDRKVSLAVDHMMVHNAFNVKAREIVAGGKLGAVNDACFHMEFAYGYDPAEAATWRCHDPAELGGPIGDVASHCFYMAEFIFGSNIKAVSAVYLPKLMQINVEDGAYIKFELANGMSGSVKVAFSEPRGGLGGTLTNLGYEVYGAEAVLRGYGTLFQLSGHADEPIKIRLELDRFQTRELVEPDKCNNVYQELVAGHAESILSGKLYDGKDALHNIKLCLAAHESAKAGGTLVKVD